MSSQPYYLLLGPEIGRKSEFVDSVRKELASKHGEPIEEIRVYPFKTDMSEIIGLLRNSSLFSSHRLVLFSEAQEIKKKTDIDLLVGYLGNPTTESTLILMSDGFRLDSRIEKKVAPNRKKIFWELFEDQKRGWVISFFRSAGHTITEDAVEMILELVDNNTSDLKRECEKLTFFFEQGTRITASQVEELVYHSKEENVFTLFATISEGEFESVLETLAAIRLSGGGEPVQLLGGLIWQIRRLLAFCRLRESNHSDEEIAKQLKIRGKKNLHTYRQAAKLFKTREVERIVALAATIDELLRSTRTELHQRILELCLYDMVVHHGDSVLSANES